MKASPDGEFPDSATRGTARSLASWRATNRLVGVCLVVVTVLAACVGTAWAANAAAKKQTVVQQANAALKTFYKGDSAHPPTTAPKHAKHASLWIVSCGQQSAGCADPAAGAAAAAQKLGWTSRIYNGDLNIGGGYDSGVEQAVAAHATAIVVVGIDCDEITAGLAQAKAAKIPVVGANSFDCNDPLIHDGRAQFAGTVQAIKGAASEGAWYELLGRAKADWLIAKLNGHVQAIVFLLQGVVGFQYELRGFQAEMKKCPGCKIVATVSGAPSDLANGVLKQDFASALTSHPNANAVMSMNSANSDGVGIPAALESTGRASSVKVIGTGGDYAPSMTEIRNGTGESAEIDYDTNWLGWEAVDETIRVLAHKALALEGDGFTAIDRTHNLAREGEPYYAKVNYEKWYEKAWGLHK